MDIQIGKEYINNTWRYLLPCIKVYGDGFLQRFSSVFKLATGVGDSLFENELYNDENTLYVLLDKKVRAPVFNQFIDWIKNHESYIIDYAYDDILKGRKHMLLLKIPEEFHGSYKMFLEGKYSKMYTEKGINFLYSTSKELKEYTQNDGKKMSNKIGYYSRKVLENSPMAHNYFIGVLKERFGDDIDVKKTDLLATHWELDLPLSVIREKEIFNYGKS